MKLFQNFTRHHITDAGASYTENSHTYHPLNDSLSVSIVKMLPYGVERTDSGISRGFRPIRGANALERGERYRIETSFNLDGSNAKKEGDSTNQYIVRAIRVTESQYTSLRSALTITMQRLGWRVEQVSFIAGARSLNEEDLKTNLAYFKVPSTSIETIRTKLDMKIFDEYVNILTGMYSIRFKGRSNHGDTSTRPTNGRSDHGDTPTYPAW